MTVRVEKATPLQGFTARLKLTDGSERIVDLEPLKRDPALFRSLRVDEELGTIVQC